MTTARAALIVTGLVLGGCYMDATAGVERTAADGKFGAQGFAYHGRRPRYWSDRL